MNDIVKRTHWHIIYHERIQPERFFSLAAAHNAARADYPATKASFTERPTNRCEICEREERRQ